MKERPILFTGEMVRAILDDRKSQTRRLVKPQPQAHPEGYWVWDRKGARRRPQSDDRPGPYGFTQSHWDHLAPYGLVGDKLWVRETAWYDREIIPALGYRRAFFEGDDVRREGGATTLKAPFPSCAKVLDLTRSLVKRPSIHMPRWASRLTLEITGVRVERLQEISETDAMAEGTPLVQHMGTGYRFDASSVPGDPDGRGGTPYVHTATRGDYATLWERINGVGSWAENPWVWVIEFARVVAATAVAA